VTAFAAALHEGDVACLLRGLTAEIATAVSQDGSALFHYWGLTVAPTAVGEERRHPNNPVTINTARRVDACFMVCPSLVHSV
jgi:hypothetical protein